MAFGISGVHEFHMNIMIMGLSQKLQNTWCLFLSQKKK
jgi:hypothetical protein